LSFEKEKEGFFMPRRKKMENMHRLNFNNIQPDPHELVVIDENITMLRAKLLDGSFNEQQTRSSIRDFQAMRWGLLIGVGRARIQTAVAQVLAGGDLW
jgi:hypothetical protein